MSSQALDLISQVTATVEPGYSIEDRMRKYGLDPEFATIRNGIIIKYRGSVNLSDKNLKRIPFNFVKVIGSFYCNRNKLRSLIGCPATVGGNFDCSCNELTDLSNCPRVINFSFWCNANSLKSILPGPKLVRGDFWCHGNPGSSHFKNPGYVKGEFHK